jgi:O-antigen/teichoic acid export membrane protein
MVIALALNKKKKTVGKIKMQFDFSVTKQSFKYGFQNELSSFFHYLAARVSYYFIVYYLSEASLGILSVGVSISESIWTIARSISTVQYSHIIREGNTQNARKGIVTNSLFSIVFSFICFVIVLLLPSSVFAYVFGNKEFSEVKQIILLMSPGILFIAFSTVYGHYFAAIGKMNVLILKSVTGAVVTVILSAILIPRWEIAGACITSSIVHFICSAIIIFYFVKDKIFVSNNSLKI